MARKLVKKKERPVLRDRAGHILPGSGSPNPEGLRSRPETPTSREARKRLPVVIERIIRSALKDSKWLDALRKESPVTFASCLTNLTRYVERDEPPPPAEESMSNKEAMEIINQIKADAKAQALEKCTCQKKQ